MVINDAGRKLIMEFEGLSLTPYLCPAGKWTVGYGHVGDVDHNSQAITQHQAEVILEFDLHNAECEIDKAVSVALNENQFSALVSFVFNVGPGRAGFKDGLVTLKSGQPSTLLRRVNAGQFIGAAEEFLKWDHANGKPLAGLTKRRAAERALFLTKVNQA